MSVFPVQKGYVTCPFELDVFVQLAVVVAIALSYTSYDVRVSAFCYPYLYSMYLVLGSLDFVVTV